MTMLHFEISINGVNDDSLVVHQFDGYESLSSDLIAQPQCHGFRYDIELASRNFNLSADGIIDELAELSVYRDGRCVQRVVGIVRSFTQGNIGKHHAYYSLTLVPSLERLSLRHNSRIFQQKTAIDIISQILAEMEISDVVFALVRECEPREFCVQYRETDLAFIQRIAAEEGMFYYFEHQDGLHTLVFSDNTEGLPRLDAPVMYNNLGGGVASVPYISSIESHIKSEVSEVTLQDRTFKKPNYTFSEVLQAKADHQRDDYTYYDFPARFKDQDLGKAFTQIRLEYLRREAHTATGESDHALIRAGYRFALSDHYHQDFNRDWLVVSVHHRGEQKQALEENAGEGVTSYSNTFMVVPSTVTWRPTPQTKPQVDGSMTALVVGPDNEEIYCDEFGRVRVQFPWDRYSENNEHASCWIRVSQGWAGSSYGTMFIPRVGHEVIVSFLNGDPDQPIVTGSTYHANNLL
ncbi:type VI secretion system tip protein TssI/VgrG [Vibrio jasicida]|uniref:type VI secretion system tip protein TssI/VgrG n=1 Tax=Vibrio jasicida TaxID=766224 RepID=UPI000A64DD41|nr:type VI secretion system tip protein TssI/VgrG [Vibrio jasicida]